MVSISKVAIAFLAITATALYVQPYRPVIVSGPSMTPTFDDGALVFSVPVSRALRRGDIVLVDHDGVTLIKRVTMVPGDQYLEVKPSHVKTWSIAATAATKRLAREHAISSRVSTIPAGMLFITGDNSLNSLDSRSFGLVPIRSVLGVIQPLT